MFWRVLVPFSGLVLAPSPLGPACCVSGHFAPPDPPVCQLDHSTARFRVHARTSSAVRVEQHHEEGTADSGGHQEEPVRGVEGLEGDRGRRLRWNDVCAGEDRWPTQADKGEKNEINLVLVVYVMRVSNMQHVKIVLTEFSREKLWHSIRAKFCLFINGRRLLLSSFVLKKSNGTRSKDPHREDGDQKDS